MSNLYIICLTLTLTAQGCKMDTIATSPSYCDQLYPPLDTIINNHTAFTKDNYPKRITDFMQDTLHEGDIIMLGNSLTQYGGFWSERFNNPLVKNRGIAGDNTYGIIARINEITCSAPSKVFLMAGTNDLWLEDSPEQIVEHIEAIVSLIKRSEETSVYVQTIMPVEKGHEKTQKIADINTLLKEAKSDSFLLLDTYHEMADGLGALPVKYTTDGVHLTQAGYDRWVEFLKPYIQE